MEKNNKEYRISYIGKDGEKKSDILIETIDIDSAIEYFENHFSHLKWVGAELIEKPITTAA